MLAANADWQEPAERGPFQGTGPLRLTDTDGAKAEMPISIIA
jgi:hypothetical protein